MSCDLCWGCPESAQIFCFTFINIYTARLSDWTQTLLLADGFIIPKVQCVQQVWKCTPLHKCEQKHRTKTLITFPDPLIPETICKRILVNIKDVGCCVSNENTNIGNIEKEVLSFRNGTTKNSISFYLTMHFGSLPLDQSTTFCIFPIRIW